jgi:Sugar (and other) transporter
VILSSFFQLISSIKYQVSFFAFFLFLTFALGNGSDITFYMGATQVVVALIGIFILDKIGRRPLLIWAPFMQGVSMLVIFLFIQIGLENILILPVLMFNVSFVLGLGGMNLPYTTEIVSPKVLTICVSS